MAQITSGVGLVSGINYTDLIDKLMSLEEQPKTLLQTRKDTVDQQKVALTDLTARLTSLKLSATTLKKPSAFQQATTTSSDENVLTATASAGAATGSFQFRVAQLVASQQSISAGFASTNTKIGAGTLTIEMGGGDLSSKTPLSQLNGGAGVRRGVFRITDRSGHSAAIDISDAITLDDVARNINNSLDISVRASVGKEGLTLTDQSNSTSSNLIVQEIGDGAAATDLGIVASVGVSVIHGADINSLGRQTSLSQLNDGRGVRTGSGSPDLRITASTGANYDIALNGLTSVGAVLDAINTATGGAVKADVAAGANGIRLTDSGGGAVSVTALNGSNAAADLGIAKSGTGVINGSAVIASLDSVLISSLKGGSGMAMGGLTITDRSGASHTVNLSGATTVQDILDAINSDTNIHVKASLKASGNGIQIADTSGGTGNLVIADADASATATSLGLAGSFDISKPAAMGANLQRQWISRNTLLADMNGGKGISTGVFTVTNSSGHGFDVDLSTGSKVTLGQVMDDINARAEGVTASINANGDGLLLTDTAGGTGKLTVADADGTSATDLRIGGTATGTTIDGSYETTIDVTANDNLTTIQNKINQAGFGVSASIINDGSAASPFRLSLTARNTGRDGRVVFDGGATAIQTRNLVEAQDAAVFFGDTGSAEPLLVTSSTNQLTNVIQGVTVNLQGVSDRPVTLNITRSADSVVTQLQTFTDTFNQMVDKISDLTKFDTTTNTRGLLLGDNTIQQIQSSMYDMLQTVVSSAGKYRMLADVGLTLGDGAKLTFDADKFKAAYANDPDSVQRLFAAKSAAGTDTKLSDTNGGKGVSLGQFRITNAAGASSVVSTFSSMTIAQLISAINATGLSVTAALDDSSDGLTLTDASGGAGKLTLTDLNGTPSADLGIDGTAASTTVTGSFGLIGNSVASVMENQISMLTDPVNGIITLENNALDQTSRQFQDRMDQLDKLLADKKLRLQTQFANLETVLAGLQSQQQALNSLTSTTSSSTSSSTKSSSSSSAA